ncbi:hypothetical protein KM043_000993 [Ampulex compressa]|nr:hypothetical protein KM043_000993 [Ampulex compressa]
MISRLGFHGQKLQAVFESARLTVQRIAYRIGRLETPERIKGTFLERWGTYWKNLYIDYRDVTVDTAKHCRERPIRTTIYASVLACAYYCYEHNPDERSFREHLLRNATKLAQLGEAVRNPISAWHVKQLEQCYNEGTLRRLNLGIISLIWVDNYDESCSLYKAVCPYLKPRYFSFHERAIDVGFLDKWWILEDKMTNYDVNEAEFQNDSVAKVQ